MKAGTPANAVAEPRAPDRLVRRSSGGEEGGVTPPGPRDATSLAARRLSVVNDG